MGFWTRVRRMMAVLGPGFRYRAGLSAAHDGAFHEACTLYDPLLDLNGHAMDLSNGEFSLVLRDIAYAVVRDGRAGDAEGICRRALTECGVTRHTGSILTVLGMIQGKQGRGDEAAQTLIKAIRLQRRATGLRSPEYRDVCERAGDIFESLGGFHDAAQCQRAIRLSLEADGADRNAIIRALLRHTDLANKADEPRLLAAVARRLIKLGDDKRWAGAAYVGWCLVAEVQIAAGEKSEAEKAIASAADVARRHPRRLRTPEVVLGPMRERMRQL